MAMDLGKYVYRVFKYLPAGQINWTLSGPQRKRQVPSKDLTSEGPFVFGVIEKIEFMADKKKGAV